MLMFLFLHMLISCRTKQGLKEGGWTGGEECCPDIGVHKNHYKNYVSCPPLGIGELKSSSCMRTVTAIFRRIVVGGYIVVFDL